VPAAPFGATSLSGSATGNAIDYTGREDDGTALKYYRARYYHPALQRFISEDPLEFGAHGSNLYGYVLNAPMTFVDPLGTDIYIALYEAVGGTNHIGIGVNSANTVGFYSNPPFPISIPIPFLAPGEVVVDRLHHPEGPIAVIRISRTQEQDKAVMDLILSRFLNPGKYNLASRNCSNFVQDALKVAGVDSGAQLAGGS